MASTFTELAVDCADPAALARFWCAVLDYEVRDEDDGLVTIGPPGEGVPVLTFAAVPEVKAVKNRLHLDVTPAGGQEDEVRRLLELGAQRTDVGQGEQAWVVLADPEGNEFCVLAGRPTRPDTDVDVARALLQAYRDQDRARAESLVADGLTFTSPQDDRIDRAAYFDRCFPTADRFRSQTLLHAVALDANDVLLAYEYELPDGARHRNTEILTVHDGRVTEIQVFFGGEA